MADDHLPPLNEQSEETVAADMSQTRPHAPINLDDTAQNERHQTELRHKNNLPPVQPRRQQTSPHVQAKSAQRNPRQQRMPRRRQTAPKDSALYLPWWSIALMLFAVIVVSLGIVAGVIVLGGQNTPSQQPTAIIMIVTAEPIVIPNTAIPTAQAPSTQIISAQSASAQLELSGPTLAPIQLSATPAPILIGSSVIVQGVDLQTLNVRDSASLSNSSILFRAEEGDQFTVVDGPAQSDGFTWWRIQDPTDVNRAGWAVSNFLQVNG